jgi:hypothetical protein
MKDAEYKVEVAFTKDELLCCKCNCKVGSEALERGICVHILPEILLFVILLLDGLAEHILVELCHWWDLDHHNLEEKMTRQNKDEMKESVFNLIIYLQMM